jgi:hypothetical protein
MAQPDGYYPRLNAAMLNSGNYNQMIVSVVGKVRGATDGSGIQFQCADGACIRVSTEHGEMPDLPPNAVVEIVGQASSPEEVAVRLLSIIRLVSQVCMCQQCWVCFCERSASHEKQSFSSGSPLPELALCHARIDPRHGPGYLQQHDRFAAQFKVLALL